MCIRDSFTIPRCTFQVLKIASKLKKRVVIGTTGFTKNEENLIKIENIISLAGLSEEISWRDKGSGRNRLYSRI